MNTLIQPEQPVRSILRSTGILGLSLVLTIGVLVALASVVDGWA
jgi:hypothetical protein